MDNVHTSEMSDPKAKKKSLSFPVTNMFGIVSGLLYSFEISHSGKFGNSCLLMFIKVKTDL